MFRADAPDYSIEDSQMHPRANATSNNAPRRRVMFNHMYNADGHDGVIEEGSDYRTPSRKKTQKDQDDDDEEQRKKAMKDLIQSWMDRLQLISVITTFFASTEAGLLQVTMGNGSGDSDPHPDLSAASNAGIVGALVLHVFAAVVSFLASFLLIRFKLKEAKKEEYKAETGKIVQSPSQTFNSHGHKDLEKALEQGQGQNGMTPAPQPQRHQDSTSSQNNSKPRVPSEPPVWSSNPHLVQVGPFAKNPPTHLLSRCHTLCVWVSAVGFVLFMFGIICFTWAQLPRSVSVFASAALAVCLVGGTAMVVCP